MAHALQMPVPQFVPLPVPQVVDSDSDGSDDEEPPVPFSPLHGAAAQGHLGTVKALVGEGHEIDEEDDDGKTPLYLAFKNGHGRIVNFLMKSGASTEVCCDEDSDLLHRAAEKGNVKLARILT